MILFVCFKNENHIKVSNGQQQSGLQVSAYHQAKSLAQVGYKTKVAFVNTFKDLIDQSKDADFIFIQAVWLSAYDIKEFKKIYPKKKNCCSVEK